MTLEDFFTLTEMRDGLTAPSRVQELVSEMQKEQDSVVKNACDATRQWAAVASTIAATENKDCLDLFIQLDGLLFINRWLNESHNFGADANDGFIEESISALLRAIEKLQLDSKKSISSGIWGTVHKLLGHHSSRVRDRARQLFDSWEGGENGEVEPQVDRSSDKIAKEECQPSAVTEGGNDDGHASETVVGEKSQLRRSDSMLPEKVATEQIPSSDNAPESSVSLDSEHLKEKANHFSSVLTPVQEVAPISEGVATVTEICNSHIPKPGNFKGEPDDVQLNDLSKAEKLEQNNSVPPENSGIADSSFSSSKLGHGPVSLGATETNAPESVKEPTLEHNDENNENGVCHIMAVPCDMRTPASDAKSAVDDVEAINSSNPQPPKASENDNECVSNMLQDSSVRDRNLGKSEQLEMPFLSTEYVKGVTEGKGQVSNQGNGASSYGSEREYDNVDNNALKGARQVSLEKGQVSNKVIDASNGSDSSRRRKRPRIPNLIKKTSDIELEYGIVDALEVARQVAQEVEREVRSSSSEEISEGRIRRPGSSGSPVSSDNKYELTHVLPEEVSSRQSNSADACSEQDGHMSYSDNIEAQAQPECLPDLESSQVTEAAQDPGGNSEKSLCTFDLNEEIGSNGMDVSVNTMPAAPIPVVSVSKPAQSSGPPTAPLQFEGTLGWKGSAVTSAFRPASPRRSSDSERNVSVGGNSHSSKRRHDFLDIDLNVADGDEELVKQKSSGLPFEQSLAELNPKQSSRLDLDLNSVGDDGDIQPSNRRTEAQLFSQRNDFWSPLHGASSSSMQPSVRNIDLNDRPYFQTALVEQGPSKSLFMDSYGRSKSDAPVISILGAKVEVDRREHVPQTISIPNGKGIEPVIDLTMSGAGAMLGMCPSVSYSKSAVFGYNGLTSGPHLSFSSAMYASGGTIPYMVDSRGAPVVPQVGGSSSTILPSYSQPPVVVNMAGTQLSLNGVGSSPPNFDLNSNFMTDGGPRDTLAARQFFFPSSGRALEEHARTIPQSSSSGGDGKRKEPDSGWDPYPFSYRGPQPPWK
ncbi:hypothetical protein HN51_012110 [Arachis hypogaea]|uniref:TFIIS N-terminal domain-containing protein n=1 Tax=Arachis hypogaea TaxID=3818 RepID=A0A445DW88_ARAHY|nr:uncharacterized protein LOC112790518 [Arachis hypogaea]QHO57537.1 uncharacterized protein DS421_3g83080 [Arachis hypogaea]RYR67444.1 hypothetical protein Ahy_A03g013809 [Arachis hypogaea]